MLPSALTRMSSIRFAQQLLLRKSRHDHQGSRPDPRHARWTMDFVACGRKLGTMVMGCAAARHPGRTGSARATADDRSGGEMRKLARTVALAGGLLAFAHVAPAAVFENGNQLYAECTDRTSGVSYTYCLGYIAGVTDEMSANPINGFRACIPDDAHVTIGQMKDVVVRFLWNNARIRDEAAFSLVAYALQDAFPCASAN